MRLGADLGIDFGTSKLAISVADDAAIHSEPSLAAARQLRQGIVACGQAALDLVNAEPGVFSLRYPVQGGHLVDRQAAEALLSSMLVRAGVARLRRYARVVAAVPSHLPALQRRALLQLLTDLGFHEVSLVSAPLCAAAGGGAGGIGPDAVLVADIGTGCVDCAVLSMGQVVRGTAAPVGGAALDDAIVKAIASAYGVQVPLSLATPVRVWASAADPSSTRPVRGRRVSDGLTGETVVRADELQGALRRPFAQIVSVVAAVVEAAGPELAGDVAGRGLVLAGGLARCNALAAALRAALGCPVAPTDDPEFACARGLIAALQPDGRTFARIAAVDHRKRLTVNE